MRLHRLGSFHQSRLSFLRVLLRRMSRERWQSDRTHWDIDARGVGTAVYQVRGPARTYSLVAVARELADCDRSDRVIASAWDASFVLFDGVPDKQDIERLSAQVPMQETGRLSGRELTLSRANRSVRLFNHVRQSLAAGRQPSQSMLDVTGYLMRTTAVYGSGKFGALDHRCLATRAELAAPFQAEMLTVYLIRQFSFDIVEHLAASDAPAGHTRLTDPIKRALGVGNATGLGMAPFLINHPVLFNNWILARETALQRVRSLARATDSEVAVFVDRVTRALLCASHWHTANAGQEHRIRRYRQDLRCLLEWLGVSNRFNCPCPWNEVFRWAQEHLSVEGQEAVVSLLLEPHGGLIDELVDQMRDNKDGALRLDGAMRIARLMHLIEARYGWALLIDFSDAQQNAKFWYVSADKLEPRLGDRYRESGAVLETPLAVARDAATLHALCKSFEANVPVASLVLQHPGVRHIVRRVQALEQYPYAEIRDNLISTAVRPIDMLRCKLSFFGANHFDPRSDRWVRITLARHAPLLHELAGASDDWIYPHTI